jgi:hypothetical protein
VDAAATITDAPGGGRGLGTPAGAMYAPGSPKQVLA